MFIQEISFINYRNLKNASIKLSPNINIFYGDNAQGKTNFLETIYFCATGRSHRSHQDNKLINFDFDQAHVKAIINKNNNLDEVSIHIKLNSKKGIAINKMPIKKLGELFGTLIVVIFSPEDLFMIKGSPSIRRRFVDIEMCQISKIYYYELQQYYKILKNRNILLKNAKKNLNCIKSLDVWDGQLVEHGKKIIFMRQNFIEELNAIANKIHTELTDSCENLIIKYEPSVSELDFEKKLYKNINKDIILGSTSIGIHKDDISFFINNLNVKNFGSQGQQRTTSISLRLAQIQIIKKKMMQTPIFLLDDVLSELDQKRQIFLLKYLKSIQTIITCTDYSFYALLSQKFDQTFKIFKVDDGIISL